MNNVINKFLLTGDKFMPEMHLRQPQFVYSACGVNNFWSNNYIEYKNNGDKNKILSVEGYLNKIRPYLKAIINNLKKSGTWKIQLIRTIFIFSSEDDNDEEHATH